MDVRICNKYLIHVDESCIDLTRKDLQFNQFIVNPKYRLQLAKFTWCWEKLVMRVLELAGDEPITSVTEYFGGVGRSAVIIQNLLHPKRHIVMDFNPSQAVHLENLSHLYPGMEVFEANAFRVAGDSVLDSDFVTWDSPYQTLASLNDNKDGVADALRRVLANEPRFFQMCDTALAHVHLHKELYSGLAGWPVATSLEYLTAINDFILRNYLYYPAGCYYYHNLACLLYTRQPCGGIVVVKADGVAGISSYFEVI